VLEFFSQSRLSSGVLASEDIVETNFDDVDKLWMNWFGFCTGVSCVVGLEGHGFIVCHSATPSDVFVIYLVIRTVLICYRIYRYTRTTAQTLPQKSYVSILSA